MFVKLVLVFLWLCVQQPTYLRAERAFKVGDVILGALNVLHYKGLSDSCGHLFPVGLGHTEAMIFAIEQINNDPFILPNITLGYDIRDYCETISIAMKETYEYVRDRDLNRLCENISPGFDNEYEAPSCCSDLAKSLGSDISAPITLLIGPYDSASAVQIGSLLNVANIPILSFAATSDELSSEQYRYFMRTVPPDSQQARVQADLFERFNWTYVGTVALDDSYGRFGVSALENEAYKRNTFCIAFSEFITRLRSAKIPHIVSRIKERSDVQVIVVWVFGGYARLFFEEAYNQNLGRRTWILGDSTTTEESGLLGPYFSLLDGALGVHPQDYRDEMFFKHLTSLTPRITRSGRNPWWKDFWRKFRNCSFDITNETNPHCLDVPLSRKEADMMFDPYLIYLTDALFSAAYALDRMFKCVGTQGLLPGGACPQTEPSVKGEDIMLYLRNVSFEGKTGTVEFNKNGDPKDSSFQIVNVQIREEGLKSKFVVGTWNSQKKQRLELNNSAIRWAQGVVYSNVPVSVCSQTCPPGTRKRVTTPCCWKCVKCPGGTVSTEPGSANCTKCPKQQKPNDDRTECVPLPF